MACPDFDYKRGSLQRHAYRMEGLADDLSSGRISVATYIERVETMAAVLKIPLPDDWAERTKTLRSKDAE